MRTRIQKFWNKSGVGVWKSDSGYLCAVYCGNVGHDSILISLQEHCIGNILSNNGLIGLKYSVSRRVARIFYWGGGKQQPGLNIYIFNAPYFFTFIRKMCLFLSFFFLIIIFALTPAYRKTAFIELTCFKSVISVKFKAFTLDESHHLLVKLFLRKRL